MLVLSEWLWFNANSAIFQLYHGKNKFIFNKMMMRSVLYLTNMPSWIFIVLGHWNNSPRVDMLLNSDTLFWFRANQSFLFLLNAACLAEKQQISNLVFGLTWLGLKPTIYRTWGKHANYYATDAVFACVDEYLQYM
jgi:hypothetical protein